EGGADHFTLGVDHRRAGVAADDVVGRDEVIDDVLVDAALGVDEALGRVERLGAGGALVQAAHVGEGRHGHAAIGPAFHLAIGQAEREGRVGVEVVAIDGEAGLGDLFGGAGGRAVDTRVPLGADGLGRVVIGQDEGDHRVARGGQLFRRHGQGFGAEGRVDQPGLDQLGGDTLGVFAAQHRLHVGVVHGQVFAGLGEPEGQLDLLDALGDRGFRGQTTAQGGDVAVGVAGAAFGDRLGAFLRRADDGAGVRIEGRTAAGVTF